MSEVNHGNQFLIPRSARQWESLPRQTASPERWLGWARAVGLRYLRHAIRPQSLGLVLAERRAVIHSRIERWQHIALTVRPRINLTLNSAVWSSNLNIVYQGDKQAAHSSEPSNRSVVEKSFHTLARNWTEKTHTSVQRLKEIEVKRHFEMLPALARVFTRSSRYHENRGVASPNHAFDTYLARHSVGLTRRVIDERSRIEDQTSRVLLTLQQRETTKEARRIEETVIHSASEFNSRSAERFGPLARAPIDIDQLTDQVVRQIDNRIVAYRERLGKVF